jgi:DNA polymerase-3 subunit delta
VISLRVLDGRHNVLGAMQPLLERPPEAAWLIVEAGDLPKTSALRSAFESCPAAAAVLTGEVEAGDLASMIRTMAESADVIVQPEAMELLANILGGDRLATRGEIDKLLSYVGPGGAARVEDVEAIVGETAEVRNGQIIDAALLGGAEEVEANLVRLKAESASVSGVASQAVRHLITLQGLRLGIDRGGNPGQVVKTARPPIFFKRQDAAIAALRRWPYPALARARVMLDEAVATSRRQPSLEFAVVSDALQRIASMARRLESRSR